MSVVHRRDAYKDKKKTMSDVKYVYLDFKVNKCSDLVAYNRSCKHGGLPDVADGEFVISWPVSVEGSDIVAGEAIG